MMHRLCIRADVVFMVDCSGANQGNPWTSSSRQLLGRAPNRAELRIVIAEALPTVGYEIRTSSSSSVRTKYLYEMPTTGEKSSGIVERRDRLNIRFVRKAQNESVAYLEPECQEFLQSGLWRRGPVSARFAERRQWFSRQVRILLEPVMPQWTIH